jgi:DNA end-binding protein Ku
MHLRAREPVQPETASRHGVPDIGFLPTQHFIGKGVLPMASRPIWRGHLRLALVSCPIALYNARHDRGGIRFNMINPETGNRIRMVTQDAETGKELERRDLVKGYEFKKNTYLLLTDEDFDSVKVESSSVMTVEKFVAADSIDPMYYDASYFMAPDGKAGDDVYAVLREAITKTGMVALSRVVISQRERTIALRPIDDGLMAHTLYEERDLNSSKELFEDVVGLKPDPEMVQLATQLIQRQAGRYDPSDLEDRYETRVRAMIDAKLKGEGVDIAEAEAPAQSNVIDLMAALKKSLGQTSGSEAPPKPSIAKKTKAKEPIRNQPGLKLPIKGGKTAGNAAEKAAPQPAALPAKPSRKRA